jgi:hypothetical protein
MTERQRRALLKEHPEVGQAGSGDAQYSPGDVAGVLVRSNAAAAPSRCQ